MDGEMRSEGRDGSLDGREEGRTGRDGDEMGGEGKG